MPGGCELEWPRPGGSPPQLATLKNHLTPLVSRDVFFALSGKESLVVNDPGSPRVLVLASGEEVRRARSPLVSTVLKTLMRQSINPGNIPAYSASMS